MSLDHVAYMLIALGLAAAIYWSLSWPEDFRDTFRIDARDWDREEL